MFRTLNADLTEDNFVLPPVVVQPRADRRRDELSQLVLWLHVTTFSILRRIGAIQILVLRLSRETIAFKVSEMASLGMPRSAPGYFLTVFCVIVISQQSLAMYNPTAAMKQMGIGDEGSARIIGARTPITSSVSER